MEEVIVSFSEIDSRLAAMVKLVVLSELLNLHPVRANMISILSCSFVYLFYDVGLISWGKNSLHPSSMLNRPRTLLQVQPLASSLLIGSVFSSLFGELGS